MRVATKVKRLVNSFKRQMMQMMIAMEAMKVTTLMNLNGRLKVLIASRFSSIAKIKMRSSTMNKRKNRIMAIPILERKIVLVYNRKRLNSTLSN